jgi:hypothetical protein
VCTKLIIAAFISFIYILPAAAENKNHEVDNNTLQQNTVEEAERFDLLAPAMKWEALNKECALIIESGSLVLNFNVDHKVDGEISDGKYPKGWPRVRLDLPVESMNMANYDFFHINVNISSNRGDTKTDKSSLCLTLNMTNGSSCQLELLGKAAENKITAITVPVKDIIEKLKPAVKDKNRLYLRRVQLVLPESNYADETKIKFEISNFSFVKIKSSN